MPVEAVGSGAAAVEVRSAGSLAHLCQAQVVVEEYLAAWCSAEAAGDHHQGHAALRSRTRRSEVVPLPKA